MMHQNFFWIVQSNRNYFDCFFFNVFQSLHRNVMIITMICDVNQHFLQDQNYFHSIFVNYFDFIVYFRVQFTFSNQPHLLDLYTQWSQKKFKEVYLGPEFKQFKYIPSKERQFSVVNKIHTKKQKFSKRSERKKFCDCELNFYRISVNFRIASRFLAFSVRFRPHNIFFLQMQNHNKSCGVQRIVNLM
eukprot:TRINITY_DN1262_c0_g2_i3.p3 TRINITY_DN1262_c0_g2~~TRINITY_DN1262_c0_g2_i3.p3  ORF type:complete len:188 (+),score=-8.28 TRINITY_DN1262_c0_g2_i3:288-851(+)